MKKTHTTKKVLNKKTAESCNNKATYKLQISTLINLCFGSFIYDAKVTDFQYRDTENLKTCDLKTKANDVLTVSGFICCFGEKMVIKENKKRLRDTVLLDNS